VALDNGFEIPHLCYNESVKPTGLPALPRGGGPEGEVENDHFLYLPVLEGIEVLTQSEKSCRARRMIIELILAMCPGDKLIQDMATAMGSGRYGSRGTIKIVFFAVSVPGSATKWSGPTPSSSLPGETRGK